MEQQIDFTFGCVSCSTPEQMPAMHGPPFNYTITRIAAVEWQLNYTDCSSAAVPNYLALHARPHTHVDNCLLGSISIQIKRLFTTPVSECGNLFFQNTEPHSLSEWVSESVSQSVGR